MYIHVSKTPEQEAGIHIYELLQTISRQQPVLLLLAGGSSLQVLQYINERVLGSHMTIMMGDERFTEDPQNNNSLQLQKTAFYERARNHNVTIIDTVPNTSNDTPDSFAYGIDKTLHYYFKTHPHAHVICLFGIGSDGHFASIFPDNSRSSFYKTFHTDAQYVAIHAESLKIPDRMTITPYFIKHHTHDVILFATGEEKCERVLKELTKEETREHQLPALIPTRHPNSHLFTDCTLER